MKTDVDLLASYWTIAGGAEPHTEREFSHFSFHDRVAAISRVGFKGMGLWHADLEHTLRSHSLIEMKHMLDDHGIVHLELEFLHDWFAEGPEREASDERKRLLLDAAEVLGAHHIKVGDFFNRVVPMPQLVDSFRSLCREAAGRGTRIGFELMPFAMITSLEDTLTMVEGAGEPNGGVILDLWHLVKLGIPFAAAASIPAQWLIGVELNDGFINSELDLVVETTQHRQLCGEGEFDVRAFIASMRGSAYEGPYGIEVLNAQLRTRPLAELAQVAYSTTRAQFHVETPLSRPDQ